MLGYWSKRSRVPIWRFAIVEYSRNEALCPSVPQIIFMILLQLNLPLHAP